MENSVVESTDADGLNFNGNATSSTVKNNFLRNTGDDAWRSGPIRAPTPASLRQQHDRAPTLANGIADYGGSNNTISNNVIADTNALGSGLTISNEAFLQPFRRCPGPSPSPATT